MGKSVFAALSGVAGGIRGGMTEFARQQEHNQRQSQIDESARIRDEEGRRKREKDANDEGERQRMIAAQREIIDSMPDENPDGSPNTLKTALKVQYGFKGNIGSTIVRDAGQTARHEAPSGSVIANNQGAMDRLTENLTFSYDKLNTEEAGRNARWATPSGNAKLGSETTRRGQDVGASTARRGQDVALHGNELDFHLGTKRNETTRRGQDQSFSLGTERNRIAGKRGIYDVDFNAVEPQAAEPVAPVEAPAPTRAPIPVTPRGGGAALPTPENVSDGDLDTLAKSILDGQGIPSTPQNIKTFKDKNRDALAKEIARVRRGGG